MVRSTNPTLLSKKPSLTHRHRAMHMDPSRYPDPETYSPERFLDYPLSASAYVNSGDVAARDHFAYGDGKRICVGIHLAERSLFTLCSCLLQAFQIVHAKDSEGKEITVDPNAAMSSLAVAPLPFSAAFRVRNKDIGGLLEKVV